MKLNELSPAAGSTKEAYRKGRGSGSGNGKTAGRGHKGQKARSGGGTRIGFEGGQMPLARRIPKRGFNNIFAKPLEIINLTSLDKFEDGDIVTAEALLAKGILSKCEYGYKVLGNGKVTKKVTVQAAAFSQAAKEAIEAAGGKAEVVLVIQTIKKAWGIPELRKKIIFTALILLIFRIGNAIPVPYVNTDLLSSYLEGMSTTVLGLYNVMSGGAFAQATVFALGVQPYINSSIIIQLLTIAIPALERLARDGGEEGKKKIQSITRYATVAIAILQGWGYYMLMKNYGILTEKSFWVALVMIASFIAGSSFVMWMGEQITEFGIGNGISIILFAGILSRVPSMVSSMVSGLRAGTLAWWAAVLVVLGILALIVLITWVNGAERRIPVQYAKRQVGRKMYGGQASTLPMKVNMSGVLPIIFAQSIAMIPSTIAAFCKQPAEGTFWYGFLNAIDTKSVLYMIFYFLMIIAFSYFYATIQFNPVEISNNLKKNGGFIPGFRPGKPTTDFIKKVLNKVTLFGAIYLGVVAILPLLIGKIVGNSALSIGGTSVIIVVGVALETVQALESQMLMRQYKGFLE